MSRPRARLLLLTLTLAVGAAALSTRQARADPIFPLLDFCAIAPAQATPSWSTFPSGYATADSQNGYYASSFCGRYVVDFKLPDPGTSHLLIGALAYNDSLTHEIVTPSFCNGLTERLTIYRSDPLSPGFTRVRTGVFQGAWDYSSPSGFGGACLMIQTAGDPGGGATAAGGNIGWNLGWWVSTPATYRAAFSATIWSANYGTQALPAYVTAWR